jgi:hypothetical protein
MLFEFLQCSAISIGDEIDGDTLAAETTTTTDSRRRREREEKFQFLMTSRRDE